NEVRTGPNMRAKFLEGEFGMISRGHRLVHRGGSARLQSRKQNGGFYLRARYRHCEIDRLERATFDFQWKIVIVTSFDGCAEAAQRVDDSFHGAAGRGLVADERGLQGIAGGETRHEPDRRSRISGI